MLGQVVVKCFNSIMHVPFCSKECMPNKTCGKYVGSVKSVCFPSWARIANRTKNHTKGCCREKANQCQATKQFDIGKGQKSNGNILVIFLEIHVEQHLPNNGCCRKQVVHFRPGNFYVLKPSNPTVKPKLVVFLSTKNPPKS